MNFSTEAFGFFYFTFPHASCPAPSTPAAPTVTSGNAECTVTDNDSDSNSYTYRVRKGSGNWEPMDTDGANRKKVFTTGITNGQTYSFSVQRKNPSDPDTCYSDASSSANCTPAQTCTYSAASWSGRTPAAPSPFNCGSTHSQTRTCIKGQDTDCLEINCAGSSSQTISGTSCPSGQGCQNGSCVAACQNVSCSNDATYVSCNGTGVTSCGSSEVTDQWGTTVKWSCCNPYSHVSYTTYVGYTESCSGFRDPRRVTETRYQETRTVCSEPISRAACGDSGCSSGISYGCNADGSWRCVDSMNGSSYNWNNPVSCSRNSNTGTYCCGKTVKTCDGKDVVTTYYTTDRNTNCGETRFTCGGGYTCGVVGKPPNLGARCVREGGGGQ